MNASPGSSEAPAAAELTVNGDPMALAGTDTIGALLARLEIRPERVVVEHNGTIYRRGDGLDTVLAAGDIVEIVHFVGGG
ncbi:MAG: sulfur carrier protein ThiS [Candidatus Dormiibacterota bacterium]